MQKSKIKVFFDSKPMTLGHAVRGIGYYTKNLLSELEKSEEIKLVNNEKDADLIHYPYFDFFFSTLRISKKPTIVTIYDTIPLLYPDAYPSGIKGKINLLRQKNKLKKVDAVITISETSKKDIVRLLDVPPYKVFPIYLAPAKHYRKLPKGPWQKEIRSKYNLPERFVLYVGDVNYNKNLVNLADACRISHIPLVIVGKQAALSLSDFDSSHKENESLKNLLEKYGTDSNVLRLGFVEDEDLVKLYNIATVYCQPSFYEGFGIPVLEALACGTQVVATKNQAHTEIAEDCCLFSEFSAESLADTINMLVNRLPLRGEFSAKGLMKVKEYNWQKTAKETISVYKQYA